MEPIIINGELYHHGILGQRWGVQNGPPYPLKGGMHTDLEMGRAKKKVGTLSGYFKEKKLKKKRAAALEKARKTRAENIKKEQLAREHEENRQKTLIGGKAADVMKYQGEMTNAELQYVAERLRLEAVLSDYAKKDIVTAADKVDNVMKNVARATDWVNKGTSFYNSVAKIVNSVNGEDVLPPILDSNARYALRSAKAAAEKAESLAEMQRELTKQQKIKTGSAEREDREAQRQLDKQLKAERDARKAESKQAKAEKKAAKKEKENQRRQDNEPKRQERIAAKEQKRQERITQKDLKKQEKNNMKASKKEMKDINNAIKQEYEMKERERKEKDAKEAAERAKNISNQADVYDKERTGMTDIDRAYNTFILDRINKDNLERELRDRDEYRKSISTVKDTMARIGMNDVDDYTDELLKKNKKNLGL